MTIAFLLTISENSQDIFCEELWGSQDSIHHMRFFFCKARGREKIGGALAPECAFLFFASLLTVVPWSLAFPRFPAPADDHSDGGRLPHGLEEARLCALRHPLRACCPRNRASRCVPLSAMRAVDRDLAEP